ncbi:MAG: hypothetical protein ACRDP6_34865 [Actinoallomurus sp.]
MLSGECRLVAGKEVRVPVGIDAEQVTSLYMRTLREASAAAKLTDPGIFMELVEGRSLQQIIDESGCPCPLGGV